MYESLPHVMLDKHRVLQILVNLITNALDSLGDCGRSGLELTARLSRLGSDRLCIQISDNGLGISEADAPRIFQHGFTTRRDGHGFGLHTSALTAQELGGELTFESAGAGAGATFRLRLPLVVAQSAVTS
jgi:signal transduction histidine kinase